MRSYLPMSRSSYALAVTAAMPPAILALTDA